jgi:hypothetical protein
MHPPAKYFKAKPEAVKVYPDGREVCNLRLKRGKQEYYTRSILMLERQGMKCAICRKPVHYIWAEFDHEAGRRANGAHRDDRIEIFIPDEDGITIRWQNAAVCRNCNTEQGSKRYHWIEGVYQEVIR